MLNTVPAQERSSNSKEVQGTFQTGRVPTSLLQSAWTLNGDATEAVRCLKLVPARREKQLGYTKVQKEHVILMRKLQLPAGLWKELGLKPMHGCWDAYKSHSTEKIHFGQYSVFTAIVFLAEYVSYRKYSQQQPNSLGAFTTLTFS